MGCRRPGTTGSLASLMSPTNDTQVLVLGIGNLLLGDEGIGVHAARRLQEEDLPPHVTVVDGGTGGFHLLEYFGTYSTIILIDAASDGKAPGTVSLCRPRYATDFPRSLTAHDIGLRDMIEAATLLGSMPVICLVTISIGGPPLVGTGLTLPGERSLPEVIRLVKSLV
jgi:hydrogenase maturation protease